MSVQINIKRQNNFLMEEERMNTIKFCLKCGHPVGPEDKFCLGCGANIADMQAQQGAASVGENTQNTVNTAAQNNTQQQFQQPQNNDQPMAQQQFEQPQQAQGFQQPNAQGGAPFQPQQNTFYAAQPQPGFGAPGAAVKTGDSWFKKNLKLIIIIASVLVVGIIAFFVIKHVFFRFQKIDAKDLIKVQFSGIDSAGVATAKLNKYNDYVYNLSSVSDTLSDYADYGDNDDDGKEDKNAVSGYFEVSESKLLKAYTKASDKAEAVKMRTALLSESAGLKIFINGEEKNAKGLKNGDKVTIKLEFNESYLKDNNIKIENAEYEVEVEGLKTGTKVDLFKGVDVKFTGVSGQGYAEIERSDAQPFVRYTFKDSSAYRNLKNGDKVVLVAKLRYAQAVDASDPDGAVWMEYDGNYYTADKATEEKEFTVSGLTELKKIDIFENIKIEYRNAIPYLRVANINTDNCSQEIKDGVRFYIDDNSKDLKAGDTIKVKAYVKSSFADNGYAPEGEKDEDGYYSKDFTVGDDAPVYLNKNNAPEAADKLKAKFEEIIKNTSEEGVDRTYVAGFSAGGKITGITFKETKTMLFEYDEASYYSSVKCYLVKQYVVTVKTDKETKTAYGLIKLRNPIISGEEVSCDQRGSDISIYSSEDLLSRTLDNYRKNYTVTTIAGAQPAQTTEKPEETKPEDKKPEETTTTKTTEEAA